MSAQSDDIFKYTAFAVIGFLVYKGATSAGQGIADSIKNIFSPSSSPPTPLPVPSTQAAAQAYVDANPEVYPYGAGTSAVPNEFGIIDPTAGWDSYQSSPPPTP
jgi:hypothetical protein